MPLTYSDELYSDFHKDVYGVRPSQNDSWYTLTPEEKQVQWAYMQNLLEVQLDEEIKAGAVEIELCNNFMKDRMDNHGESKEEAYNALLESRGINLDDPYISDDDYVCYLLGVPYGTKF